MRKVLVVGCGGAAVFFAMLFATTFWGQGYVMGLARDYVVERTRALADRLVVGVELGLASSRTARVLGEDEVDVSKREVAEYRKDPRAYVEGLVKGHGPAGRVAATAGTVLRVRPATRGAVGARMERMKDSIRAHFQETFRRLLTDLRIFTGSNCVAAAVAAGLASRGSAERLGLLARLATLLLGSVLYSSYMYVNHLSFFRILIRNYIGWTYPVLLVLTFVEMCWRYRRMLKVERERVDARGTRGPSAEADPTLGRIGGSNES